jgi:hypothetical protein
MEVRARGFLVLAGVATRDMVLRYQALGLPFEMLGPGRTYWGEERHPVRLDVSTARPRWFDPAAPE